MIGRKLGLATGLAVALMFAGPELGLGVAHADFTPSPKVVSSGGSGGGVTLKLKKVVKVKKTTTLRLASTKCSQFKRGSAARKACIAARSARLLSLKHTIKKASNDDAIYADGVKLAEAKDFAGALLMFQSADNQRDPRILTGMGFANRKLGAVDKGLSYYFTALEIDPNYVQAREYLGEGYLQKRDLTKALGQLNEIANRCGVTCESYVHLSFAIADYKMAIRES